MADCAPPSASLSSDKSLLSPLTLTNGVSADATEDVIPPVHTHRTIVLCFDGTGDQFDADVSSPGSFTPVCLMIPRSTELEHYPVLFHVEEG